MNFIDKIKIENIEYDIQDTEARRLIEELENTAGGTPSGGNLNYIGHYGSEDGLPSVGQPSGVLKANLKDFTNDTRFTGVDSQYRPSLQSGYNYIIGRYTTYRDSSRYFTLQTNFPEIIKSIGLTTNEPVYNSAIRVDASEEKPVLVKVWDTQATSNFWYYPIVNGSIGERVSINDSPFTITQPCYITIDLTGSFFGNLPQGIKFEYMPSIVYGNSYTGADCVKASYINANYIYNDGMKLWTFNPDTMVPEFYMSDFIDPLATENNVATVGDDWIWYLCDATPKWHRTGGYTKSEVDNLIKQLNDKIEKYHVN